jgi:hypothetical protein
MGGHRAKNGSKGGYVPTHRIYKDGATACIEQAYDQTHQLQMTVKLGNTQKHTDGGCVVSSSKDELWSSVVARADVSGQSR